MNNQWKVANILMKVPRSIQPLEIPHTVALCINENVWTPVYNLWEEFTYPVYVSMQVILYDKYNHI